jgi:hypothetical protein
MLRARHDDERVIKEKIEALSLVCNAAESPCNQEIDVALAQLTVQRLRLCGHKMKDDARISPAEPLDDGRNEARGHQGRASDPHFSSRRVGEELDVLQALPQVVEYRHAAIEQRAAVFGWLDALAMAIE